MTSVKKSFKKIIKPAVKATKNALKKNRLTKKIGRKLKHVLFPETLVLEREIYQFHEYYPTVEEYVRQKNEEGDFKHRPLISILLPTYNTPVVYLKECIDSVLIQSYGNWELCIADDASTNEDTVKLIKEYARKDKRIKYKVRKENGHISKASNTALEMAKGDFVALLDHDDVLWPNALFEIIDTINKNPDVDFLYTDEDKIDGTGETHSYPFLKPDFSPEFLESCNYITHFSCIRTKIMKKVGGFRPGYEGAQDWDLFIRLGEYTRNIIHIPKILYSWRIHESSTASDTDAKPYVYEAQRKLLVDHVDRIGRKGKVESGIIPQHRTIKYDVSGGVILTLCVNARNKNDSKRLMRSVKKYSPGVEMQVLFFTTQKLLKAEQNQIKAINPKLPQQFVVLPKGTDLYSTALKHVEGEYLLFADDTVEFASKNWGVLSVADCQTEGVAVVAPVLLDRTKKLIKSAGIGIRFGQKQGYLNMLEDAAFDDYHYSRGLYAKSRRNVSAVNSAVFAITKDVLEKGLKKHNLKDGVSLFLDLVKAGYRHVYTPYIQVVFHGKTNNKATFTTDFYDDDPYLNPNFNPLSQSMEVK